jgi:Fe-S-cluster containining protein
MPTKSEICRRCGECCQFFILQVRIPEPFTVALDWKEWLRVRSVQIVRETQKEWRLKIPLPCPHLDRNVESWGEGFKNSTFLCNIYGDRPKVYRGFDGRLADPRDGLKCLWSTEKIEEEEVKKYGEPF